MSQFTPLTMPLLCQGFLCAKTYLGVGDWPIEKHLLSQLMCSRQRALLWF